MLRIAFLVLAFFVIPFGMAQQAVTSPGNFRYTYPAGYMLEEGSQPPNNVIYAKRKGNDVAYLGVSMKPAARIQTVDQILKEMQSTWAAVKKDGLNFWVAHKEKIKVGGVELMSVLLALKIKSGSPTHYQRLVFGIHNKKRFDLVALYKVGNYKPYDVEIKKSLSTLSFLK